MSARPKLLLVDDRRQNLLALGAVLKDTDAEILTAESGERALELLLEHDVALALVDVQMPGLDGFQLAELMRGLERTREIPIIFVTAGLHDQARVFKGYESGAVDFLFKPLDPRILASKVEVFLQLARAKRQLAERVEQLETAEERLRTANEQLLLADRRKNDFLAVLSHELRNPLAPIRNSLYVLDRAAAGGEQARRAQQIIDRQVSQLANLVNDLLDLTRISRNKIRLQKAPIELRELVRRTAEDNRGAFDRNGVKLEVSLAADPVVVTADATRVAQVLSNLLQNSAKFGRPGGRTRVTVGAEEGEAVVRVADDGTGMAPDTLARLFEPFVQADQGLDRSKGGLGLGLALVKGIVELHGGSVRAASDGIGRGAEFEVRLPLDGAPRPEAPPADAAAAPPRRRRVLVVEDNPDAAESLKEALELADHEIEIAASGPEALERARARRPDVVLCDIGLPGMDGYDVARAFRGDPELRDVALVALSGYALPEDLERAAEAGFDRHVAKPPAIDELNGLLSRLGK